jgi:hypothetical protein
MLGAVAALSVVSLLGCKDSASSSADGPLSGDASDAPAACDCRVEASDAGLGDRVLTMSWSCYCASGYADGCKRTLEEQCATGTRGRVDYPSCGLTVLQISGAFGPYEDVYDQDGKLVGAMASSDSNSYVCPNDPTLSGFVLRAGRFPEASCAPVPTTCLDAGI